MHFRNDPICLAVCHHVTARRVPNLCASDHRSLQCRAKVLWFAQSHLLPVFDPSRTPAHLIQLMEKAFSSSKHLPPPPAPTVFFNRFKLFPNTWKWWEKSAPVFDPQYLCLKREHSQATILGIIRKAMQDSISLCPVIPGIGILQPTLSVTTGAQ